MFYIPILYIKCHYREREIEESKRDFRLLKKKEREREKRVDPRSAIYILGDKCPEVIN